MTDGMSRSTDQDPSTRGKRRDGVWFMALYRTRVRIGTGQGAEHGLMLFTFGYRKTWEVLPIDEGVHHGPASSKKRVLENIPSSKNST